MVYCPIARTFRSNPLLCCPRKRAALRWLDKASGGKFRGPLRGKARFGLADRIAHLAGTKFYSSKIVAEERATYSWSGPDTCVYEKRTRHMR